jgi:TRAP transporter 4TM/12TM fusion protein
VYLLPITLLCYLLGVGSTLGLGIMYEQYAFFALGLSLAIIWWSDRKWLAWVSLLIGTITPFIIYDFALNSGAGTLLQKTPFFTLLPLIVFTCWTKVSRVFAALICVFLLYGVFGNHVPSPFTGANLDAFTFLTLMTHDREAILGVPFMVTITTVFAFVLFGRTMQMGGIGDYLNNIAFSLFGKSRGGPAKVAVISSGLFGSFSGSAVANVITTGTITIPAMIKSGYKKSTAAALEAMSSTLGQVLPPVMGASAFIMAELTQLEYLDVAQFALIPGVVSYICLFMIVHFLGKKVDYGHIDKLNYLQSWKYVVPVSVLIFLALRFFPIDVAAVIASVIAIATCRITFPSIKLLTEQLAQDMSILIVIAAACGFIISTLDQTGLAFTLSYLLTNMADSSLLFVLCMTALISIILGMGMPTASAYIVVAMLIAPSLIELGIEPLKAHMFVLYFSVLSMVTPPVALASFAAANIAKADPMKTALKATAFGLPMMILPFIWIYM